MALCLEKAGHNVLGVDISEEYITQINSKVFHSFEPKVEEYLKSSKNFTATTSLKEGLEFSDLYFLVVATNSIPGLESYDHTLLSKALTTINSHEVANKHIIISSTVFPGYIDNEAIKLVKDCPNTDISYNPEFIAQGNIIQGLQNPDMILIGEGSSSAGDILVNLYQTICENSPYVARMSVASAEITKLGLNCFITAKIAFANLIGDIADETPGADKNAVLTAIGHDKRVGTACLLPGYGFGGPCFPRDNRALGNYALKKGIQPLIFSSVDQTNKNHADYMADKLLKMDLDEYVFEDVCYKSKCPVPIIEESQKLEVAKKLAKNGKEVMIKDREIVLEQVKSEYGNLFSYVNCDTLKGNQDE